MVHSNNQTMNIRSYLFIILMLTQACATREDHYYWGDYEKTIYESFKGQQGSDPQIQVAKLSQLIRQAKSLDKPVPPGIYAQLGYAYYRSGKTQAAREAMELEKKHHPSSTAFVNRLLGSMRNKK